MIRQMESDTGLELSEQQKRAVNSSVSCGLSVITGGPGTGQTSIDTRKWLMAKLNPKVYGDKLDMTTNSQPRILLKGGGGGELVIRNTPRIMMLN